LSFGLNSIFTIVKTCWLEGIKEWNLVQLFFNKKRRVIQMFIGLALLIISIAFPFAIPVWLERKRKKKRDISLF